MKMKRKNREEEKMQKIKLVEEFYKEFGRLPSWSQKYKGVALGRFLSSIRYGETHIEKEQMERLEALGFELEIKDKEKEKERKIKLVEEFYKEFKRLPKFRESYKGAAIGVFLGNIRQGSVEITEDQMQRITILGFVAEIKDVEAEKERKLKLIEEFYQKFGKLPSWNQRYKEVALGEFLGSIRQGNTEITEEQMDRLKKIGFEGQINNIKVERCIQSIEQFHKKTGRIPMPNENLGKRKIGEMLVQIRIGKVRITESQFLRLQQMDATLTREQVVFFEKPKIYTKCGVKV